MKEREIVARMIEDPPYPSMGMNLNSDSIINCAKNMGLHSNEPSYVIMPKNLQPVREIQIQRVTKRQCCQEGTYAPISGGSRNFVWMGQIISQFQHNHNIIS